MVKEHIHIQQGSNTNRLCLRLFFGLNLNKGLAEHIVVVGAIAVLDAVDPRALRGRRVKKLVLPAFRALS